MTLKNKDRLTPKFLQKSAKYRTADELEKAVADYFETFYREDNIVKLYDKTGIEKSWEFKNVPSITGLAIFLGFNSRQSILDYEKKDSVDDKFACTIKKARMFIENFNEQMLITGKGNATGLIFNLKNNFNWVDKQEIKQEQLNVNLNKDITDLSDEELDKIIKGEG